MQQNNTNTFAIVSHVFSVFLASVFLGIHSVSAVIGREDITNIGRPPSSIDLPTGQGAEGINAILVMIQDLLIRVILPLAVVGSALWVAYLLFTAEGDEAKMKKAWKSLGYTAVALVAIALSYAIVSVISSLSFS